MSMLVPGRRWKNESCLVGKTAVVTGGNSGIGLGTVLQLTKRGAKVIIGCRDLEKAERVLGDIMRAGADVKILKLDLASFVSIHQFAEKIREEKINILINNAGIFRVQKSKTDEGIEMQFAVNYLGHFLLTVLLIPQLKDNAPSRIVNVSSVIYYISRTQISLDDLSMEKGYTPIGAYCRSKLAQILFTRELSKRLKGSGINTYSVHPGLVNSHMMLQALDDYHVTCVKLCKFIHCIFYKNLETGAKTSLFCATEESLANESGYYYSGCRKMKISPFGMDNDASKRLWKLSEKLTNTNFS